MATTIYVNTVNLTLTTAQVSIYPAAQRGVSSFNSPLIPQPPSVLEAQFHPDPTVRELVEWASALSQRLQELLQE